MNVARMRLVDRWLGVPVCFVLTLWRRVFGRRKIGRVGSPKSILFVKLAEQGSTVLAQGALHSAIQRVGRANVYFLLFAENRPILDLLNLIPKENVIEIVAGGLLGTVWGAWKAIWKMRRTRLDVAIDLEFFARASAALTYLSGAHCRVGFHAFGSEASYRGDLMTHRLSFNPYLHTSQTFQILVDALDRDPAELPLYNQKPPQVSRQGVKFEPSAGEVEEVRKIVEKQLGDQADHGRPLILLNANASDLIPLRKWPASRYIELARKLLAAYPETAIAFTGATAEQDRAEEMVREVGSDRCFSMAGKTTVRQLLVLFGLAEVLVTNDSGPAHFATLTPIDVVVLFGPETPRLFAALSPRTHPLWAGLVCSPCINAFNDRKSPCTNNVCMQEISVEQVYVQVRRCYAERQRRAVPLKLAVSTLVAKALAQKKKVRPANAAERPSMWGRVGA
jgi:ADP-heptose:LPS heptosyltransferase